ncbi:MAG: threonine ammonia-lyase [Bacteriovoracaceae bacterium]|nr:threonine ammonia-lyase [Bacteriovoracaceae bacterium]
MKPTFKEFQAASKVLSKIIDPTPLIKNEWLSLQYDCEVWLKLENMLPIGSFKMRGATYKISTLTAAEKKRGVLAVSAGNHAQGVAWAAKRFGVDATIVMPEGSPLTKIRNTESLGAKVVLHGASIEECFEHAEQMMKKKPMTFIHPYKDPSVICGQGSIGFELVNQLPDMDFVFSSIGGGGLVSGLGIVLKELKPKVKLIAAQAAGCKAMVDSLQKGKVVQGERAETFADGIRVKLANPEMFKILDSVVDEALAIEDEKIALAVLRLIERARVIAEGAGALPLATLDELHKKNPRRFKGKKVVLVVCGGNIDVNLLERIIDRGLIEGKRKVRLSVPITDRPGTLHVLTGMIKDSGANILQVVHDRDSHGTGLTGANVQFTLETKGPPELKSLVDKITKDFPLCKVLD